MSLSGLFGSSSGGSGDETPAATLGSPIAQSSLLSIDPKYLNNEYIRIEEDHGAEKSRFQTLTQTVGMSCIGGGALGALQSVRYSGLQLLRGDSKQMAITIFTKNTSHVAKTFGAAGFLYCFCSIACEKLRQEDDEINTVVGGTVAGALYSIPGLMSKSSPNPDEVVGFLRKNVRKLPPVGRFLFGCLAGTLVGGSMALYRNQANDYIKMITSR